MCYEVSGAWGRVVFVAEQGVNHVVVVVVVVFVVFEEEVGVVYREISEARTWLDHWDRV